MSYGSIKVDTLVYNNSGSDTSIDLGVVDANQGNTIKSSEGGSNQAATKFLRADGDGTCSWQTPSYLTVLDEDDMGSDSATLPPSQQSTKAYVDLKADKNNTVLTGNATINATGDFRFADADSSHYVGFQAPTTVSTSVIWTLPQADGSASQYLKTDGSGVLSFGTVDLSGKASLTGATFTGAVVGTDLTLSGNLTVNGTTTTVDTTNLDVEDKNITIGKVSSPSDSTADGGGLTLKGATDKTWNWVNSTDAWTSSENIQVAAGKAFIDDKGDLRVIPPRTVTGAAATLVAADSGKVVSTNTTGWTVPASTFDPGDTVSLVNRSGGNLTITCSAITMYKAADGTTITSITVGARGFCTIWFESASVAYLQGTNLS